jgi:hypothetical protein
MLPAHPLPTMQTTRPLLASFLCAALIAPASAATTTYLIDFGTPEHTPYVFKAGDFGLKTAPVVIAASKTGDYEGFAYVDLVYQIGFTTTLSFPKVGGYNLNETESSVAALIGSFIFSSAGRETVGSPVAFSITTKHPSDKITLSAIGSVQEGNRSVITLDGKRAIIDSNAEFIPVASQLTGKTTYAGSFTTEDGEGEANIGGFLVTIETR